jgi:peptidoglycan/LPS O-acetylase OafA/YrhL
MITSSEAEKPTRLESLTVLRFFAAIFVVAHHYDLLGFPDGPKWLSNFLRNGPHAVTFFFILSGFVLGYSHFKKSHGEVLRYKDFWAARFARIYPLYAVALLIALPFFLHSYLVVEKISGLKFGMALLLVPTLSQAWLPLTALSWNSPAWSLSVEAFFYLLFPLAIKLFAGKFSSASFVSLLFFAAAFEGARLHFYADTVESSLSRHLISYFPLFHLPKFLLGIILAKYFVRSHRPQTLIRHAGKLTWLTLASIIVLLTTKISCGQSLVGALLIVAFSALILCASSIHEKGAFLFNTKPAVVLGEASYGIYILHLPILMWYSSFMKYMGILDWHESQVFGPLYFLCVIASSLVLYNKLEIPMRRWLRTTLTR